MGSSEVNWVLVNPVPNSRTAMSMLAASHLEPAGSGRRFARWRQQMYSVGPSICIWLGRLLRDGGATLEAEDGRVDRRLTVASIRLRPSWLRRKAVL